MMGQTDLSDLFWSIPSDSIVYWVFILLIILLLVVIVLYSINKVFEIRKNKRIGSSYKPKARLKSKRK